MILILLRVLKIYSHLSIYKSDEEDLKSLLNTGKECEIFVVNRKKLEGNKKQIFNGISLINIKKLNNINRFT